jgi:hypothetical protein
MSIYIGREGEVRAYDSTGTPYYVAFVLENMDFKGPMGRPRPEETLVLDRENIDSAMHYIVSSERAIGEPVAVSFTARLDDTTLRQRLRDIIDADSGATWTVDGDTWLTTKGDFSLVDVDGNSATDAAFADTRKRCVNIEVLWNSGATDIGLKYGAVYFDPAQQEIAEAEDAVSVTLNGMCHGAITEITAFTGGNPS